MTTTRVTRHIHAPRAKVYAALLDPAAVQQFQVPNGMTSVVHTFEPRVGGAVRISLTYEAPGEAGKTTAHTDTHRGTFVELVPDARVVQVVAFESDDPALQGEMKITWDLVEDNGGTTVIGTHEGLPAIVDPGQNEHGWRMSLDKLAALVER